MSKLNLNVSLNDGRNLNIEVKSTDTWKNVKQVLQSSIQAFPEQVSLLFASSLCRDEEFVKDSSVTENSLIHCFIDKGEKNSVSKLKRSEVMEIFGTLSHVVNQANFDECIMNLRSIDALNNLISECPAAMNDPESLAAIQDPSILSSLVHDAGFYRLIDEKPVLGRLLQIVCPIVKSEESPPRRSNVGSYALDELSDDEEDMDIDADSSGRSSRHSNSQSRSADFLPITPAQLAAALANATGSSSSQNTLLIAPRSGLPTPPSTSTPFNTPGLASSSVTGGASPGTSAAMPTEVFSQALQTALAASARRAGSTSNAEPSSSSEQSRENARPPPEFLESMQLMREMGINDDTMSVEALRATNGDVQAAINLIFAQWMAED